MALTVLMSGAILAQAALEGFTLLRVVQTTAVLSGLVPYGLFFLIAVAYTAGAAPDRPARRAGAAGQRRRVGQQRRRRVHRQDRHAHHRPAHARRGRAARRPDAAEAGPRSARSPAASPPRTSPPPRWPRALPGEPWTVRDEVPFASVAALVGGWSPTEGAWVLGAPTRSPRTSPGRRRTARRGRARPRAGCACSCWPAPPTRPPGCATPAAARRCPRWSRSRSSRSPTSCAPRSPRPSPGFRADGVALKVLSGDDPRTVAALATQAGLDVGEPVAGAELDGLDDAGAGPAGRPHHRVRPGRPRAEGTDRRARCAARATTSP